MKDKGLSFLRTAIAGASALIVAEVFNPEGILHLIIMIIGFVVVSVLCEIAFAVLAEKSLKKLKVIGWILFVVLVVIFSYFKSKNAGYF